MSVFAANDVSGLTEYFNGIKTKLQHVVPKVEAEKEEATVPAPEFTNQDKYNFCINVRGWMLATPSLFDYLIVLAYKPGAWEDYDERFVHAMIAKGFGYAMVKLFKSVKAPQYSSLVSIIREYLPNDPACPIGCTYADYNYIKKSIAKDNYQSLQKMCSRYCKYVPVVTAAEAQWCDCVVNGKKDQCSDYDSKLVETADAVHKYVFTTKAPELDDVFKYKKQ